LASVGASKGVRARLRAYLRKRDFYAGLLMILIGLVVVTKGPTYRMGSLMHMGPGFLPTALGALLIVLGVIIAASANPEEDVDEDILPEHPEWWGWGCILAGPILFVIVGRIGGMIPATFACVFVSALGDRTATLKSSFVLASVVTVFGVALFAYLLQIPMPVLTLRWPL
jgi:uncharacterized membrane protein